VVSAGRRAYRRSRSSKSAELDFRRNAMNVQRQPDPSAHSTPRPGQGNPGQDRPERGHPGQDRPDQGTPQRDRPERERNDPSPDEAPQGQPRKPEKGA
jgi:hypothetical protein